MKIERIYNEAARVIERCGTRDPEQAAGELGITVLWEPMGAGADACKGFYLYSCRRSIIVVNSGLSENVRRLVLAHELGHSILHRAEAGLCTFNDFRLYDTETKLEYEANLFASELLLDDGEVLDCVRRGEDFFDTARLLRVPPELLDLKFRILEKKGHRLASPISSNSGFLKKIN